VVLAVVLMLVLPAVKTKVTMLQLTEAVAVAVRQPIALIL
jgi:hypothetical protein